MELTDRTGSAGAYTQIVLFIIVCLLFAVVVYFQLDVAQPYIRILNYVYKSNLNVPFEVPNGYDQETQGRQWANWHVDEKGISVICTLFNNSAGWMNANPKNPKAILGMKLWGEWISAFLSELEKTNITDPWFQGFPWGGNWYEFTISSTTNMAYYIVNKLNSRAVNVAAAKAIQYIIVDPQRSLGYTRDKANSAMMLFPWTLSHLITNTLDRSNPAFKYAIEQYNLAPDTTIRANEDGVHLDYSYLTHSGVYAYGYLWSIYNIYPDTKQILPEVQHYDLDTHIDRIYSKLKHPKIDTAGCALWHRARKLDGAGFYEGKRKTNVCEIIPSMRYIRYFADNVHYCARTMQTTVAYYEADQTVDDMGLYSALCRRVFHENDDPTPIFPDVGFIYPVGTTELIRTPTTSSTTTPFFCEVKPTSKSFVWTDGVEYAVLFQYQMILPPLTQQFTEVLCIFLKDKRVAAHYRLETIGQTLFAGDREWSRIKGNDVDKANGYVKIFTDLKTGTYRSELGHSGVLLPTVDKFTGGKYKEVRDNAPGKTSSYFIKKKVDGKYVPWSYTPAEEDYLLPEIEASDGNTYYLDTTLNQYQIKK